MRRVFISSGANVTGVRLALTDPFAAPRTIHDLAMALSGDDYYVSDWTRVHMGLFRSIEDTKSLLFVILHWWWRWQPSTSSLRW